MFCQSSPPRVAWTFGPPVLGPIEDITPTYLTRGVLETVRECDHLANQILAANGESVLCMGMECGMGMGEEEEE